MVQKRAFVYTDGHNTRKTVCVLQGNRLSGEIGLASHQIRNLKRDKSMCNLDKYHFYVIVCRVNPYRATDLTTNKGPVWAREALTAFKMKIHKKAS